MELQAIYFFKDLFITLFKYLFTKKIKQKTTMKKQLLSFALLLFCATLHLTHKQHLGHGQKVQVDFVKTLGNLQLQTTMEIL